MGEVVVVKAHCNSCLKETNHIAVAERKISWSDEDDPQLHGDYCYQIVACCGCDTVRFRRVTTLDMDQEGGSREVISYFPAAVSRRKPDWFSGSLRREHKEIVSLLNEIYAAVHEDLRVLAAMGIRTLIDLVITDKVGDIGSFPTKLFAVEKEEFISPKNREFLEVTIDAGSASAHRGFKPSQEDLKLLLDITENLIASIYVLPGQVKALSTKVPPRSQKKSETEKRRL